MLTPAEINELISIEVTCESLMTKCRKLRLKSAPEQTIAPKRKTQKQQIKEDIEQYVTKMRERGLRQQMREKKL